MLPARRLAASGETLASDRLLQDWKQRTSAVSHVLTNEH